MSTLRQASENWVENAFEALKTRVNSAWARVTKSGNTSTITIHDTNGVTTTANVTDGTDGTDGVSPSVTVSTITGGHTVNITDATHPSGQSFNVMDGEDGEGVPAISSGDNGKVLKVVDGAAAWSTGGGDVSHSDFTNVTAVGDHFGINDLKGKVNEVLNILKGTASIALMLGAFVANGAIETKTARLDALYNDSLVVTNVTGSSGLTTNDVCAIVTNDVYALAPWSVGDTYETSDRIYRNDGVIVATGSSSSYWQMRVSVYYKLVPDPQWEDFGLVDTIDYSTLEYSTRDSVWIFGFQDEALAHSTRSLAPYNSLGLAYNKDVTNLSSTVSALATATNNLTAAVSGLSSTVSGLSSTVSALATATNNLTAAVSGLSTTVSGLSSTVSALATTSATHTASISALSTTVSTKADKLTGAVYDFNYGTNFTLRLYETLTNVIDRMGGSITNPPTFGYTVRYSSALTGDYIVDSTRYSLTNNDGTKYVIPKEAASNPSAFAGKVIFTHAASVTIGDGEDYFNLSYKTNGIVETITGTSGLPRTIHLTSDLEITNVDYGDN